MFDNQKEKNMSSDRKNMITKELITDVLMVALLATAIILLALVLCLKQAYQKVVSLLQFSINAFIRMECI